MKCLPTSVQQDFLGVAYAKLHKLLDPAWQMKALQNHLKAEHKKERRSNALEVIDRPAPQDSDCLQDLKDAVAAFSAEDQQIISMILAGDKYEKLPTPSTYRPPPSPAALNGCGSISPERNNDAASFRHHHEVYDFPRVRNVPC